MTAILARLQARTLAGTQKTFAEVRAHNSCEFNAAADHLAAQGTILPLDQGRFWEGCQKLDLQNATWIADASLSVSTAEASAEGLLAFPSATLRKHWDRVIRTTRCTRAPTSYTADFLRRRNDLRGMLGSAFQDLAPGTVVS